MVNYDEHTEALRALIKAIENAYERNEYHAAHELAVEMKEKVKAFTAFARDVNVGIK